MLKDIIDDYTRACTQLGDRIAVKIRIEAQINGFLEKIKALGDEGDALMKAEEDARKQGAAAPDNVESLSRAIKGSPA
jgi:phage-related minor tail protein